jgi:hypothetical protein
MKDCPKGQGRIQSYGELRPIGEVLDVFDKDAFAEAGRHVKELCLPKLTCPAPPRSCPSLPFPNPFFSDDCTSFLKACFVPVAVSVSPIQTPAG